MASANGMRAVSPVVGVALLVVVTLLLATVLAVTFHPGPDDGLADDVASGDLGGGADDLQDALVVSETASPGADDVVHSTVVPVGDAAGTTLETITVEYPKAEVDLATAKHEAIRTIGVDTDADGDLERTFDESDVSGVNTNDDDSEMTVAFDTGYELSSGDRVRIRYEDAENPDAAGEYDVTVTLNGVQSVDGVFVVG